MASFLCGFAQKRQNTLHSPLILALCMAWHKHRLALSEIQHFFCIGASADRRFMKMKTRNKNGRPPVAKGRL
jgi:hypothetical protein